MDTRRGLKLLIEAGRETYSLGKCMDEHGYDFNPYIELYSKIADALYNLIGEEAPTFEESTIFRVISDKDIKLDSATEQLLRIHDNKIKRPAP